MALWEKSPPVSGRQRLDFALWRRCGLWGKGQAGESSPSVLFRCACACAWWCQAKREGRARRTLGAALGLRCPALAWHAAWEPMRALCFGAGIEIVATGGGQNRHCRPRRSRNVRMQIVLRGFLYWVITCLFCSKVGLKGETFFLYTKIFFVVLHCHGKVVLY